MPQFCSKKVHPRHVVHFKSLLRKTLRTAKKKGEVIEDIQKTMARLIGARKDNEMPKIQSIVSKNSHQETQPPPNAPSLIKPPLQQISFAKNSNQENKNAGMDEQEEDRKSDSHRVADLLN